LIQVIRANGVRIVNLYAVGSIQGIGECQTLGGTDVPRRIGQYHFIYAYGIYKILIVTIGSIVNQVHCARAFYGEEPPGEDFTIALTINVSGRVNEHIRVHQTGIERRIKGGVILSIPGKTAGKGHFGRRFLCIVVGRDEHFGVRKLLNIVVDIRHSKAKVFATFHHTVVEGQRVIAIRNFGHQVAAIAIGRAHECADSGTGFALGTSVKIYFHALKAGFAGILLTVKIGIKPNEITDTPIVGAEAHIEAVIDTSTGQYGNAGVIVAGNSHEHGIAIDHVREITGGIIGGG